ncbi:Elicitin-like protein 6 precursor [Globisporangium polare]
MQFQTLFLAAALALVGSVAADEACSTSQQTTAFTALASLLSGTDLTDCSTNSGYNMLYATALPTDAEKTKMCGVTSCHSLIATIISKNVPNCILSIPTSGAEFNVYTLATSFESDCTRLTTPASTTATPAATTATPAATTATPSSGSTPAATTATPAATTATPASSNTTTTTGSKAAC